MHKPAFFIAVAMLSIGASHAFAQFDTVKINTRFGELTSGEYGELAFKGKIIAPEVAVASKAYILSTYELEDFDVIFISQAYGTACPGKFVFVTVSSEGAKASPIFGTCYDDGDVEPVQIGETIAFSMKELGGKGGVRYIYE